MLIGKDVVIWCILFWYDGYIGCRDLKSNQNLNLKCIGMVKLFSLIYILRKNHLLQFFIVFIYLFLCINMGFFCLEYK